MGEFTISAANTPSPCLGCKDRHEKCHSTCERYSKQKELMAKANKARQNWYSRRRF